MIHRSKLLCWIRKQKYSIGHNANASYIEGKDNAEWEYEIPTLRFLATQKIFFLGIWIGLPKWLYWI